MKKSQLRNIIREIIREQNKETGDLSIGGPKPLAKGGPILSHGMITGLTCTQITQGDTCAANAISMVSGQGAGFSKDNSAPFTTSDIGKIFYRHSSGDPTMTRFKLCDFQDPRTTAQNSHTYWFYHDPGGCPTSSPCAGFNPTQGFCEECMNPGAPNVQSLESMVINYQHPPGAYWWHMLANPGRSNGAYYHQIGGGCECCHDPVANPCQNSTRNWNCNTPPQDWNQPFNPPMTPVCLHPSDPQYQVGYPCDCTHNPQGCTS
jgi:hypothetical protein